MVRIGLQLKAQLENVEELRADGEDFRWYLKLRCNNCGEETKLVYLTQTERVDVKGGRGTVNLLLKCKMCGRENTIDILTEHLSSYQASDCGKFKTIVAFECRGLEPVAFDPRGGFLVVGEGSGSQFTDVSLASKYFGPRTLVSSCMDDEDPQTPITSWMAGLITMKANNEK